MIFPWLELLIAFLFLVMGVLVLMLRRTEKTDFPQCQNCSYNLTGNISGVCPECGERT